MQDPPSRLEILDAVIAFLRERALPQMSGHPLFEMRVSINALEIVRRELDLAPGTDAAEHERLKGLLGHDGELEALNTELAQKIRAGEIGLATPGLADHLWDVALAKVAIDQPKYAGFRLGQAERVKPVSI